jgi:hypothetical protein
MIPSLILIMQSEHVYNISWILAINTTAHINAHTVGDLSAAEKLLTRDSDGDLDWHLSNWLSAIPQMFTDKTMR